MLTKFRKCKDSGKCAYIGATALAACFAVVLGLALIDNDNKRVTMIDGVYYDSNPWVETN